MNYLPSMLYSDGIKKHADEAFYGYNHTETPRDGEIYDMMNLTSDSYPLVSVRRPRKNRRSITAARGLCSFDGLYWVAKENASDDWYSLFQEGISSAAPVEGLQLDGRDKKMAVLGAYLVIFPDKKYYNRLTGAYGNLGSEWTGGCAFSDSTITDLSGSGFSNVFRPGDAVMLTGLLTHPENNKTAIIRAVSGMILVFDDNTFTVGSEDPYSENVTISRSAPDLDFIFENENRLWGCKGDTIFASKLGDPFNWNVFDGLSTDSYAATVGSAGDFTGATSYMGYPMFFKESGIYKIYGDKPGNFQIVASSSVGVARGCERSLCVSGDVLFYVSNNGVMAYTGGAPRCISACFGQRRLDDARAGSDGIKYYLSLRDYSTVAGYELFVYDTHSGLWHREDDFKIAFAALDGAGELCAVKTDVNNNSFEMWTLGTVKAGNPTEANIASFCEFGDWTGTAVNRKGVSKIQLRLYVAPGAHVTVKIMYDSDSHWHTVKTLASSGKDSYYLPVIPRRCDHLRLRIEGIGDWKLYSLTRECYIGSELK